MRYQPFPRSLLLAPLLSLVVGCGGGTPPPEEPSAPSPASEPERGVMEEPEPAADAGAPMESEEPEEEASATETPEPEPKSVKSPKDILTSESTLFRFDFRESEPYQDAKKECEKKSEGDPAKKAKCISEARKQFDFDSIAFKKKDDKWWWLTIQKRGSSVKKLHEIEVEFGEESDRTITLTTKGRDQGSQPMARVPKELVIEVPDDSHIVVDHPEHGRMVYEARMGLIGQSE